MTRLFPIAFIVLLGCGTNSQPEIVEASNPTDASESDRNSPAETERHFKGDWADQLGETVTLTGMAVNYKVGAYLIGEDFGIYVDLPARHWAGGLYHGKGRGELVRVTGKVVQRSDLPVFVDGPDAPDIQGIPVPEGTDINEAAKRYILESVRWERVEND